ncbi:MAG: hypothetical protein IT384_31725 [Deltaproteobacteria bacterium]|nr:hypothetical protein [Deltaproteobacteria bacterium]
MRTTLFTPPPTRAFGRGILPAALLAINLTACGGGLDDVEEATTEDALLRSSIYSELAGVETLFPLPQTSETIAMGTYDVASGTFTGLRSTTEYVIDPFTHKPRAITLPARANIAAVNALLRFNFTNRGAGPLRVKVNGVWTTVPTSASTISISAGRMARADWRIEGGGQAVQDSVVIGRPTLLGAGAFTVEAVPISILYEPPQFANLLSKTRMMVIESVGSSMSTSDTTSTDRKTKVLTLNDYTSKLQTISQKLGQLGVPGVSTIGTAINRAVGLLGTVSVEQTEGTEVSTEHSVDLLSTESIASETSAGLGPGRGDRLIYFKTVQVAWVMDEGELSVMILGWQARGAYSAATLRADLAALDAGGAISATQSRLSAPTLRGLLALDPFVAGGATASLPASRYDYIGRFEGDGIDTLQVSHSITTTDRNSTATYTGRITNYQSGWLGVLGLGITQSGSLVTRTTHRTTERVSTGESVTATLEIRSAASDPYQLDVYYDRIFGTFAAEEPPFLLFPPIDTVFGR